MLLDLLCGRNPEAVASSREEFLDWARERASMAERVEEAVVAHRGRAGTLERSGQGA